MALSLCLFFILTIGPIFICSWDVNLMVSLVSKVMHVEGSRCVNIVGDQENKSASLVLYKRLVKSSCYSSVHYLPLKSDVNCVLPLYLLLNPMQLPMVTLSADMWKSNWLIFDNSTLPLEKLFDDIDVSFDATVIVCRRNSDGKIELFSVYRVFEGYPLRYRNYELNPHSREPSRYNRGDLEGHMLKAAVNPQDAPNAWYLDDDNVEGFGIAMWSSLQRTLNFTSTYIRHTGSYGALRNGTWSGAIGLLIDGTYDVIIGDYNIYPERMEVVDFSQTMKTSRYAIYIKQRSPSFGYAALLAPLNSNVWLAISGWIFLGGLAFMVITKVLSHFELILGTEWNKMGYIEAVFFVLRTLSFQGSPQQPTANSLRVVFVVSYMIAAVIIPSYSASLISSLTQRTPEEPFKNLDEIFNTNFYIYVNIQGAEYNFFSTSSNEVYQRIVKERLRPHFILKTKNGSYASLFTKYCNMIGFSTLTSDKQMDYDLDWNPRFQKSCEFQKLEKKLSIIHHSWAFRKGTSYLIAFNHMLLQFREFGILQRAHEFYWKKLEKRPKNYAPITFGDVNPIFIMYTIGAILAFCLLAYEHFSLKRQWHLSQWGLTQKKSIEKGLDPEYKKSISKSVDL